MVWNFLIIYRAENTMHSQIKLIFYLQKIVHKQLIYIIVFL